MNLPNKLTMLRIFLIPIFVIIFYIPGLKISIHIDAIQFNTTLANILALVVFIAASYTDHLDGKLARKYNLVTTFGKFVDPLADKLLILAALLVAIDLRYVPAWIPIVIISRELMVTGIRLLAVTEGKVIAASPLGKIKTVTQIVLVIALLLFNVENPFSQLTFYSVVNDFLIIVATFFTIISGYDYFIKNKQIILQSK